MQKQFGIGGKMKAIGVSLNDEIRAKIYAEADRTGNSYSSIVKIALADYFENNQKSKQKCKSN